MDIGRDGEDCYYEGNSSNERAGLDERKPRETGGPDSHENFHLH